MKNEFTTFREAATLLQRLDRLIRHSKFSIQNFPGPRFIHAWTAA